MDFSIDLLPNEIIVNIFDYLNLGDLLTCGLTCRRWYFISQDTKFLKKIEFIIDSIELKSTNPAVKHLIASERKCLNWSLKSVKFTYDTQDHEFWSRFGRDIISLNMTECQMSFGKIAEILKHLPNLESLTLNKMELFEDLYDMSASLTLRELDCLYGYLNNIKSFDIIYELILSDVVFCKLMQLMPNIEKLSLIRFEETPSDENDISWKCLKKYILKQAKKLKSLIIHGWTWNEESFDDLSKMENLNLEVLEIVVCYYKAEDETKFSNFLKSQRRLKSLKISSQYMLDCHLITICNYLKELEILEFSGSNQITDVSVSELHKLKSLKSLAIFCASEAIMDGISRNMAKNINDKLVKLEVNIYCDDGNEVELNYFVINVCKLYRNLTFLNLGMNDVNDVIVQSIIENLRWLRSLELKRCAEITDYGITGIPPIPEVVGKTAVGYSISRLKGLKQLRLNNSEHLTERSFVEIVKCKELQVLDLECTLLKLNCYYFNGILRQCGSLENLNIRNFENVLLEDTKKITKNIPRLKHFSIV